LISLLLRFRSSLVALQQFACRCYALFALSLPNLDGLRLDVILQILHATMWLQIKEVATTEIYWLKACASHFKLQSGIPLSR